MGSRKLPPLKRYSLDSLSVLLADDDSVMRSILRSALEAYGFGDVRVASNGVEACKHVLSFRPDIVITDWLMQPGDGIDVIRMIRSAPDSPVPFVPIVMLSGYSDAEHVKRARDAGATTFLAKPITAKTLFDRVLELINHQSPFVADESFFGPDRRRRADRNFRGEDRRAAKPKILDATTSGDEVSQWPQELELVRTKGGNAAAIGEFSLDRAVRP